MLKLTPKINCYLIPKILLSIRIQKIWKSRDQEKQAKINPIEIRGLVGYSFLNRKVVQYLATRWLVTLYNRKIGLAKV